jgi:hypothetical protein
MEDGSPPGHRSPLSLGEYSSQIYSGRKLLSVIHRPQRHARGLTAALTAKKEGRIA